MASSFSKPPAPVTTPPGKKKQPPGPRVEQQPLWQNSSLIPAEDPAWSPDWPSTLVPHSLRRYSGMTAATDVAALQAGHDRKADARAARSSLAGMTLRTAWEDMHEALVGIPADLYGSPGPVSLRDLFLKGDRVRGLGLWMAVLASLALLVW
jgi:hypothetical protein